MRHLLLASCLLVPAAASAQGSFSGPGQGGSPPGAQATAPV